MSILKKISFWDTQLSKFDKYVISKLHKVFGIKAKDFVKKKKEAEEGVFNKFDLAYHIETMELQLKKILKEKSFPNKIEMRVYDIEFEFKGDPIDRQTGFIKPTKFVYSEVPYILEYFKEAGFDIEYNPQTYPLEGPYGEFIFHMHYDD